MALLSATVIVPLSLGLLQIFRPALDATDASAVEQDALGPATPAVRGSAGGMP